jgi:type IV pilus assembly protein PilW
VLGSAATTDNTFGPFNDAYKRHAYTSVVRLVNVAGRLE